MFPWQLYLDNQVLQISFCFVLNDQNIEVQRSFGISIPQSHSHLKTFIKKKLSKSRIMQWKVTIGHGGYVNIPRWLRGPQDKLLYLVLFYLYPSLFWELRDKRSLRN